MPVSSPIKQLDLKRQIDSIRAELNAVIADVIDNTAFVGGQAVKNFEAAFAEFCDAEFCIGVGNGTDALHLIFWALGIQPGDEVITTPMSFIATAEPLMMMGIKPVFADIDPKTYTLDADQVADKISSKTRAILPVHLYGQPASLSALLEIANRHNLPLIEDSAQAHGSEYQGKRIGSWGVASAFSFYPGKNLGAFGDGGAVTTNNPSLAEKIRKLADHGRTTKYEHDLVGVNSRLDNLQAAILSVKLKHLDEWNQRRVQWAARYCDLLANVPNIQLPELGDDRTHVYHQFVIQVSDRQALMDALSKQGIMTGIHYPIPLHLQPAFASLNYKAGAFPVSEKLANQCVSLPMFAELTEPEVVAVANAIKQHYGVQ